MKLRFALSGTFAACLVSVFLSSGCESEPCVGAACDVACSDELCGSGGTDVSGTGGTNASGTGGTTGGSANNGTSGPCSSSANCAAANGFECVQGQCRHACRSHYDCAGEGRCEPLAGEAELYCDLSENPALGDYVYCPNGDDCPPGTVCLGAGPGDSRAYCSKPCPGGDNACAAGFFCTDIQDENGQPTPYCVRRSFCAPCDSDVDCLAVPGQICARDQSGAKICTKTCDAGVDSCPWGNASVCGVFDTELNVPTCAHRFGSCRGEGNGCEPCARDSDCPKGFCFSSTFTAEHWCVDQTVTCDCDGKPTSQSVCEDGNGCPESPDGIAMMCFDNTRGTGDPFAHHCFGATTSSGGSLESPQTGCWEPQ